MLRAVPSTMRVAWSRSRALRSCSFRWAISRTWTCDTLKPLYLPDFFCFSSPPDLQHQQQQQQQAGPTVGTADGRVPAVQKATTDVKSTGQAVARAMAQGQDEQADAAEAESDEEVEDVKPAVVKRKPKQQQQAAK